MGLLTWLLGKEYTDAKVNEAVNAVRDILDPKAPPAEEWQWTLDIDEIGPKGLVIIETGDMDGSGESPGVRIAWAQVDKDGPAVIECSAREMELIAKAAAQAATKIKPSERLRQRNSKWNRELKKDEPTEVLR